MISSPRGTANEPLGKKSFCKSTIIRAALLSSSLSKYGFSSNKYSSFSRLANGGGKILLIDVIYEKLRKRLTFFKIWRWVLFICIYTLNIKSMNKIVQILFLKGFTFFVLLISVAFAQSIDKKVVIPVDGNTWQTNEVPERQKSITNDGIHAWENDEDVFHTFFRVNKTGSLKLWMRAASQEGESTVQIKIGDQSKNIVLTEQEFSDIYVGDWELVDTGYVKIELKGIAKEGKFYPEVASYTIAGTAVDENTKFVKNNEGNFFYWGRRGPSVHLRYPVQESMDAKWYYNEVTVPEGEDVVGSYYMANGFAGGYFGIQVNSDSERRVLFSVWSPFVTDNPKDIPEDQKIKLLKKGKDVNTGEFGNEGSGGQSFLRYNWKAGNTYKF